MSGSKASWNPVAHVGDPLTALSGHEGHGAWYAPRKMATVAFLGLARKQQDRGRASGWPVGQQHQGLWPQLLLPTPSQASEAEDGPRGNKGSAPEQPAAPMCA